MKPVKVTFLGTGTSQGIPLIGCKCHVCLSPDEKDKRLRSSILIETAGTTMVIDTGPDFRQQMLRSNTEKLDAVVFTHEHKDHIAGFDDIRAYNYILQKKMDVYASLQTEQALKRDFHYVFEEDKYPGVPEINLHRIENKNFSINGITVIPVQVYHHRMPVFGFRIGNFCYITDANHIPEEEKEKIKGCEILVLNALRRQKHVSHFTLQEAIELAQELKAEKTFFTHISHQLGKHHDVEKELPENIRLAYDGLIVQTAK